MERLAGAPRARPSAPEVARSLLPALFIFQRAEPGAARRCVRPSEHESARRLTPWPPRGARTPWRLPRPRRAPDFSQRAGQVGAWGVRASGAGRGWAGAGRGRGANAGRAASRSLRTPRGAQGQGGAGREPPGAGPGAAAGTARGVASAPGSQLRARCALAAAPLPVPPLPPLPLRPLLDVSSRSRRGSLFFFSLPFLLCQGSREPRGEASPRTFKGAMAVGTRGAARGSRHEGGRGGVKLASWASGDFLVPSPSGPSITLFSTSGVHSVLGPAPC